MNPSALAFQYFSPVPSPVLNRDEKSVFTSFSSRILKSFNFRVLTSEAFSIGLVDHWEREDCLTKKDHPYEMGDKFVGIMNRKISASTTNFYIFVHLLKSLGEPERALAREMEAAVGVYRAEDRIPAATLQDVNLALRGTQTIAGSGPPPPHMFTSAGFTTYRFSADDKPTLKDLQYMSYICEIGNNIHFRLMDRIKPHLAEVAIALDFSHHVIDNLEPKRNPVYYVLAEWLKGGNQKHDSRPTWGKLINALRAAGLMEEVNILEQYFVAAPQVAERRAAAVEARVGRVIQTDS